MPYFTSPARAGQGLIHTYPLVGRAGGAKVTGSGQAGRPKRVLYTTVAGFGFGNALYAWQCVAGCGDEQTDSRRRALRGRDGRRHRRCRFDVLQKPVLGTADREYWHCLGIRSFLLQIPQAAMNKARQRLTVLNSST